MIKDILNGISKKMKIDFEEITSKINHNGEKGNSREELLQTYLKSYFPNKFSFCKGTIINSNSIQSKQQDIIIYDAVSCPVLLDLTSTKFIPIESVYATIEVKSTLNKSELVKALDNIKSVRSLKHNSIHNIQTPVFGALFAYTSDVKIETIMNNIIEYNQNIDFSEQVCLVCILDQGLIVNINLDGMNTMELFPGPNSTNAIIANDNTLLIFYLLLLQSLYAKPISPPNMMMYAGNGGLLKATFSIPTEHIPKNGYYNFGENKLKMEDVKKITELLPLFKHIQSGKASQEELLDYFENNLELMAGIFNSNVNVNVIDIYGYKCDYQLFFERLHSKESNQEFFKEIYDAYKKSFEKS